MRKEIVLFLFCFFIFQFVCVEMGADLSVQKGCALPLISKGAFMLGFSYAQEEKTEPVDPNLWDFGRIKQGTVSKHDFILKNETNDILGIKNIHTSCGCTVSESDKKSLMPQESTAITVSFNSQGYTGPVKQFIYVNTDKADLAIIKFIIKAQVVKED